MMLGLLAVFALIGFTGWLVFGSGGTQHVYVHLMYLPIVLCAFLFGVKGGLLAAVAAGLVAGPFMQFDASANVAQPAAAWLYRMASFAMVGAITGFMSSRLNRDLDKINKTYGQTLKAFSALVAMRDSHTSGHCERVAHNAVAVGEAVGLSAERINMLYWGGILHDLGKVVTPAHILAKPRSLTAEEYEEVKKHAVIGADLLTSISPEFTSIAEAVGSHHERWDGSGYPGGLAGEAIPLYGRILAVVDVFEALTSQRPYRNPLPANEALRHVQQEAGNHFDPAVVARFEKLYREGRIVASQHDLPAPAGRPAGGRKQPRRWGVYSHTKT